MISSSARLFSKDVKAQNMDGKGFQSESSLISCFEGQDEPCTNNRVLGAAIHMFLSSFHSNEVVVNMD